MFIAYGGGEGQGEGLLKGGGRLSLPVRSRGVAALAGLLLSSTVTYSGLRSTPFPALALLSQVTLRLRLFIPTITLTRDAPFYGEMTLAF